jgi:hypothetical protein
MKNATVAELKHFHRLYKPRQGKGLPRTAAHGSFPV